MDFEGLLKAADGGGVVEIRCMRSVLNCSNTIESVCFFERGRIYDFAKIGENYVIGIDKGEGVVPIKKYTLEEKEGHWTESLEKTIVHFELAIAIKKESVIVEVVVNKNSTFIGELILDKLKKANQIRKLYSDKFVEIYKNGKNEEEYVSRNRVYYEVNTNQLESFCTSFSDVARMRLPGEVYASWFKTNTLLELDVDPAELAYYNM